MRIFAVIIPRGLSYGVVESQVFSLNQTIQLEEGVVLKYFVHQSQFQDFSDNPNIVPYESIRYIFFNHNIVGAYFRSFLNYCSAIRYLNRIKSVYDFRALASYESFARNNSLIRFIVIYFLEFFPYLTASEVRVVSFRMAKELRRIYRFQRKVTIIPCLTAKSTSANRSTISSSVRFCYVGGLDKWQMIDNIINYCVSIEKKYPKSWFLFISKSKDELEERVLNAGLKNYDIKSGNQSFVLEQLESCEFGFLFREDLKLNKVASPIKLLEYASRGVIPIMTNFVGDYSSILRRLNACQIVDMHQPEKYELPEDIIGMRKRLLEWSSTMTWDRYDEERYTLQAFESLMR